MPFETSIRRVLVCLLVAGLPGSVLFAQVPGAPKADITPLDPLEQGFFSKRLDFHGIPIKAHAVVADQALWAAYGRLNLLMGHLLDRQPMVISNLAWLSQLEHRFCRIP